MLKFVDRPMSYELMAEDMKNLLDHLSLDSVYMVGWSDGGNTGISMALNYPKINHPVIRKCRFLIRQGKISLFPKGNRYKPELFQD